MSPSAQGPAGRSIGQEGVGLLAEPDGSEDMGEAQSPLSGIRIFDLTSVIMGPLATQVLGDLGADVITVEPPQPSLNRMMSAGPAVGLSGIALNLLRNKRSIVIDLTEDAGKEVAARLAASCDVFVSNLRRGSLQRLGLAYDDLRRLRPDIIYCQAQGYPPESEEAEEPAYDDVIQAASGLAHLGLLVNGSPSLVPTILADKVAGLVMAQSILAALVRRGRCGQGAHIEVPMTEAVASFVLVEHGAAATAVPPQGSAGYPRIMTPNRKPAATRDGWVHVLPYSRRNYNDLFRAGGRTDLVDDPRTETAQGRLQNSSDLYLQIASILKERTTAEWITFCRDHGIPASPVRTLDELVEAQPVLEHPLAGPYHANRPLGRFDGVSEPAVRHHAPLQGENSREILGELGLGTDEVDRLMRAGIVGSGAPGTRRRSPTT